MTIDANRGLITVWMVQHAGFPGDGGKSQGAFNQEAMKRFGKSGSKRSGLSPRRAAGPSHRSFHVGDVKRIV